MNNKIINKEIRKLSNTSSLPVLVFLFAMLAMQIVVIFGVSILESFGISVAEDVLNLVLYIILDLIITPTCLFIFLKTRGQKVGLTIRSSFAKPKMPVSWIAKWIIIGTGFGYLSSYFSGFITWLIETIFNITLTTQEINMGNTPIGVITTIGAVMLGAPIFEELLFRSSVYRNNELMGQGFAVVLTGITFGLWHTNWEQTIFASILGIFLCFLYAKTRSVIPSMILHFCINTISSIVTFCYNEIDIEMLEKADMDYIMEHFIPVAIVELMSLLIIGIMIAAIVLFIIELAKKSNRDMLKLKKSVFPYSLGKRLAVYFSAPLTIVLFVYMIAMTIFYAITL